MSLSPRTVEILMRALDALAEKSAREHHACGDSTFDDIRGALDELELAVTEAQNAEKVSGAKPHGRRPRTRRPVGAVDANGYDLRPDPTQAGTPAVLMEALRAFRSWAGNPSYRAMAAAPGIRVAHSTLYAALRDDELPSLGVIVAIVMGCGGSTEDVARFSTAWRQLAMEPGPPRLAVAS